MNACKMSKVLNRAAAGRACRFLLIGTGVLLAILGHQISVALLSIAGILIFALAATKKRILPEGNSVLIQYDFIISQYEIRWRYEEITEIGWTRTKGRDCKVHLTKGSKCKTGRAPKHTVERLVNEALEVNPNIHTGMHVMSNR